MASMTTAHPPLPEPCRVAAGALVTDGPLVLAAMQSAWDALDDTERATLTARLGTEFCAHWAQVACASPYWRRLLQRHPQWLLDLDAEPVALEAGAEAGDEDGFLRALRRDRQHAMARIIWQDLWGPERLDATLTALTRLAEACLASALDFGQKLLAQRHGLPRNEAGAIVPFAVLAMGKLGGCELNLSSDIDLLFVYGEGGQSDGPLPLDLGEYFQRLARWLIRALDTNTAEGFVFRVDTRLRPFGDVGPLCVSAAALEQYYQAHGRDWERFAWIKARPVAGDLSFGKQILADNLHFAYRRYLDFTALTGMREVKALMDLEQGPNSRNLKKGRGGIREIEFICQALQLIHGGRLPALRQHNTLAALAALRSAGLLTPADADFLESSYRLWRRVEHALQMVEDRQTQQLPDNDAAWQRLACALAYGDPARLREAIRTRRERVHALFRDLLLEDPEPEDNPKKAELWQAAQAAAPDFDARTLLAPWQFVDPEAVWERLRRFAQSRNVAVRLSRRGRQRLDQLLPRYLDLCQGFSPPDVGLQRLLDLTEALLPHAHYLALLAENADFLATVTHLLHSPWLAQALVRHPILLDDLLSRQDRDPSLWRQELAAELAGATDTEERMDALRRFKNSETLLLAADFWTEGLDAASLGGHLSELAEVAIQQALQWAEADMLERHGSLRGGDGDSSTDPVPAFAVIAYGKLGGREMGLASDLDLVFLYDAPDDGESDGRIPLSSSAWFARLGQRLIHILTLPTRAGILYEIDMRLRPSGQSGPLVSSWTAFARYQRESAWTWEHQALCRARPIAGSPELCQRFAQLRREILCRSRQTDALARDIVAMRQRIHATKKIPAGRFDLKLSPGGLTDIEFLVQFAMLSSCPTAPQLSEQHNTGVLIAALRDAGIWTAAQAKILEEALGLFRYSENRRWLALASRSVADTDPESGALHEAAEGVLRAWREILGLRAAQES